MAPLFRLISRAPAEQQWEGLVPLLASLCSVVFVICLVGLVWCFLRRKKHRAPIIPYHLHTLASSKQNSKTGAKAAEDENATTKRKSKREPFGSEGRDVGYGFNPIFREAYGGGGGAESGKSPIAAHRVTPLYG
jgi:hypothetical protein